MVVRRQPLFVLLLCALLVLLGGPSLTTASAGVLSSSVSRTLSKRAMQRAALKQPARKAAARSTAERVQGGAAARRATAKAPADILAETRANSVQANRLHREGKISWAEKIKKNQEYDAAKHKYGQIPVQPLPKDKVVQKYFRTTGEAKEAMRHGIEPGRHLTSGTKGPGRESAVRAQQRLGLSYQPRSRVDVQLHKGQPITSTKAVGGGRGVGEILPAKRIPPEDVGNLYTFPGKPAR